MYCEAKLKWIKLRSKKLWIKLCVLGTWTTFGGVGSNSNEETAETVVALAYDSGINVFDLSEAHSGHRAEIQLGRILLRRNWNRSSYVVTTKIYWSTK